MMNAIAPNSPGASSTSSSIRSHKKYRPSAFDEALSKPLLQSPPKDKTTTRKSNKDFNPSSNSSNNNQQSTQDGTASTTTTTTTTTNSSSGAYYTNKLTLPSGVLPTKQTKVSLKKTNNSTNPFSSKYQPPTILSRIMTSTHNDGKEGTSNESKHDEETQLLLQEEQQQQQQQQLQQSAEASSTLEAALLQERHSEAVEISRNMRQIRDISKDLATIVNDQQAQFDELEEDIDGVHDSAEQGLTQLQKANGYAVDRNGVVNSFSENRYKVFIGFFAGSGLLTALVYLMNAFFL